MDDDVTKVQEEWKGERIAEYHAARSCAEHHEYVGWLVRSIMWAASVLLLGYSIAPHVRPILVVLLAFCGVVLLILPMLWNAELGRIKRAAIDRCWELEDQLHMSLHLKICRVHAAGSRNTLAWCFVILLSGAWIARAVLAHWHCCF